MSSGPPHAGPTPAAFVQKWRRTDLPERAASHERFLDLCRLLGFLKQHGFVIEPD